MAPDRVCLLLLGSSRYRFVYHHLITTQHEHVCANDSCTTSVPWPGCHSTLRAPTTLHNVPVEGGSLCRSSRARLYSLSYFLHYGVANDTYNLAQRDTDGTLNGWVNHLHLKWNGSGWRSDDVYPHSPLLIWEAARRFLGAYPATACRRRVVFSSFLWDVARYHNHMKGADVEAWGRQYARNLSAVLAPLRAQPWDRLFLEQPFMPEEDGKFAHVIWRSRMHQHMRDVATAFNVPVLDTRALGFKTVHPNAMQSAEWWDLIVKQGVLT